MIYPPEVSSFYVGNLNIHFYGIIIAFAITVCIFVLDFICKKIRPILNFDIFNDVLPVLILVSVFGARIYYVLLNFDYYYTNPKEIFMIWQGGLSIHGAILSGLIALIFMLKAKKVQILAYIDAIACVLPLGQSVGRWGNYVNQEAFGTPCNYFWCMYIKPAFRPYLYKNQEFFHPAFLYESFFDLMIFILLFLLIKKCKNLKNGIITGVYIVLYSIARIIVEILRTDAAAFVFGIPIPIFVSIIFLFFGLLFILYIHRN